MNETTLWAITVFRIVLDVTSTSDTCEGHAYDKGEINEVPIVGRLATWELKTLSAIPVFGVKLMRVMKGQNGMD